VLLLVFLCVIFFMSVLLLIDEGNFGILTDSLLDFIEELNFFYLCSSTINRSFSL